MFARGVGFVGVAVVCIALASCGDRGGAKTERSSAENVAAQLDLCANTPTGFAQNVCANRALAALDTQIREVLVEQSAKVSDAGAQMLVQNQRRWREAARLSCGIGDAVATPSREQQACLEGEFRRRLQDARNVVQEIGGYRFQRMELVDAAPVPADVARALGDAAPLAVQRDIRFPRIDGEQTAQIQRFNDLVAQQPQFTLGDGSGEVVHYDIVYAGPEVISVRFNVSDQSVGSAHSNDSLRARTVLMSEGRLITEADVFQPESGWQDYLTQRSMADLTRQFSDVGFTPPERDVRETATKPHLWLISERGLIILFPAYALGGPQLGNAEVTIPWSDLRPYLNPAAPAPIRATA